MGLEPLAFGSRVDALPVEPPGHPLAMMMDCVLRVAADEAHELDGHTAQDTEHAAEQAALREVPLRHPQRQQDLLCQLVRTPSSTRLCFFKLYLLFFSSFFSF